MRRLMPIFLLAFMLLPVGIAFAAAIDTDEEVIFFPAAARVSADGNEWLVPMHAWVFEPEKNSILRKLGLAALAKEMGLSSDAKKSDIFKERANWFLVDSKRGKAIQTDLSADVIGPSEPNGHMEKEIRLPFKAIVKYHKVFKSILPAGDDRVFQGEVFFIPPEGVSVVSDIDDTIKISHAADKKLLMQNTFEEPWEASPGMAAAYRGLAKAGATIHYLSASPWQLYPTLTEFMAQAHYPAGVFHMKSFRMKDGTFWNLFQSVDEMKKPVIRQLLSDYPKREFILIGDSGQLDPEIYGRIALENTGRIRHIYIRNVTADKPDSDRYKKAFDGLDVKMWTVFDDPAVIKAD